MGEVTNFNTNTCWAFYLGTIDYQAASAMQEQLLLARHYGDIPNVLLLLQHPPIFTLGASGKTNNIIAPRYVLEQEGISVIQSDRGGDVIYHGPGQLVGYLIFDLELFGMDIYRYVQDIERAIISLLDRLSISGHIDIEHPGVWVGDKKICAIGIRVRHRITKHGFALNVNPNLNHFSYIIPCGIGDKGITSISQVLGRVMTVEEILSPILECFATTFSIDIRTESRQLLEAYLANQSPHLVEA